MPRKFSTASERPYRFRSGFTGLRIPESVADDIFFGVDTPLKRAELMGMLTTRVKAKRLVLGFAAILFVLLAPWALRRPASTTPTVTLAPITNTTIASPAGALLRIRNDDEKAILLTDLIVETNSPSGWRAFSHTVPTHPQRLATGDTKDLVFLPPGDAAPWRLRVAYGKDIKGPMLWLAKVAFAASRRTRPGPGFGVMAGSNSCIGPEMPR